MKKVIGVLVPWVIIFLLFTVMGCTKKIERNGTVVDRETQEPLQGVSIDFYLKHQTGDSLVEKVVTDNKGHFHISKKIDEEQLFQLRKDGYIGHVNSLSTKDETIALEREKNESE